MPLSAVEETLLETFDVSAEEREALAAAIAGIPEAHGIRGLWMKPMPTRLAVRDPALAERFLAWAEPMGTIGAFSWMPISWATLSMARAATLIDPDDSVSVVDRCRRYMVSDSSNALEATMLRSMVQACGNDLGAFIETTVRGAEMFYNHGELSVERRPGGRLIVHGEGHHAYAEAYFVPGYYEGIVDYFGAKSADFEILGPHRWTVTVVP